MEACMRVLMIDAGTSFYRMDRYRIGSFFGPVDLGLFLAGRYNSLNIGTGLLAGSIFPGSDRLVFTGFSPCWGGFFISSMGGAGLVFDNLGINMLSIVGKAPSPSILYLNRVHGEEIQVEVTPVDVRSIWVDGRGGVYALMDDVLERLSDRYEDDPRILAVGPAAEATDIGAICSAPITKGKITYIDTWAGRGGLGSKLLQQHGIAAVVYGGTFIDQDFRDRNVADQWFMDKYEKKMAAKDLEATTKYRFDPKFQTGGTFGVNYATLKGSMLSFNYSSIYLPEEERLALHDKFIVKHYLAQFNKETIDAKQQKTCGEPCVAVCKKLRGEYKKDYEPYQTMGPLCGIFDQRAAEKLTHHADMYGFDAISIGGVLAWLMECLSEGLLNPKELGVKTTPVFTHSDFDVVSTSMHNAELGVNLLDAIVRRRGFLDLSEGARKLARHLARDNDSKILNRFVYSAYGRKGWMVPNQYWTPGVLSPMPIMGKYYMYYGQDFIPPRKLGRISAERLRCELVMDTLGFCRFHRLWAEEMIPEIMGSLYGLRDEFFENLRITASRISSRNASVFWESARNVDFVHCFLKRKHTVDKCNDEELTKWIDMFETDKDEAALSFWYEMHKGIQESLREF
jgi:glyceraldehyde-3-phosphate dehydrogenase (ferredoxin)